MEEVSAIIAILNGSNKHELDELDMMKKQLATIEAQRDILEGKIKGK
jgi:hypothetical protein